MARQRVVAQCQDLGGILAQQETQDTRGPLRSLDGQGRGEESAEQDPCAQRLVAPVVRALSLSRDLSG